MNIIFVGGGTAGHINPALALADYIRKNDSSFNILYVGAKGGMEENLVTKENFEFKSITISGFSRKLNFNSIKKNLSTIKNLVISSFESKRILKEFKPDICIGTGGYVCGPLLREAYNLKIPFLIHDSNSYPGLTTKLLAKKASKVLIVNEDVRKYLPKTAKTSITGTPVREKILNLKSENIREKLGLNSNPVILSFGGSLGANAINKVIAEIISKENNNFNFIHAYGKNGHSFIETLEKNNIDYKNNPRYIMKEYINNMDECLAVADLVICRAGATTLSELQAVCKPAILIPSPNVAENHQYHNALTLFKQSAASLIEEKNLTCETLYKQIQKILNGPEKNIYKENLKKIAISNSSEIIYKIILETLNQNKEEAI